MSDRVTLYLAAAFVAWFMGFIISTIPRAIAVCFWVAAVGFLLAALIRHLRGK